MTITNKQSLLLEAMSKPNYPASQPSSTDPSQSTTPPRARPHGQRPLTVPSRTLEQVSSTSSDDDNRRESNTIEFYPNPYPSPIRYEECL